MSQRSRGQKRGSGCSNSMGSNGGSILGGNRDCSRSSQDWGSEWSSKWSSKWCSKWGSKCSSRKRSRGNQWCWGSNNWSNWCSDDSSLVNGNCCRVFRFYSRFVWLDCCSESKSISNVVNGSDSSIDVSQSIRTNNLTQSIAWLSSEGSSRRVIFVVSKGVVSCDLWSPISKKEQKVQTWN